MQNLEGDVVLSARFEQALVYAARLHRTQRRKVNRVPYVSHLIGVAALVLEDGGNEDETIAALLHDAIEDQGGDVIRNEIYRHFGQQVGQVVEGCTEPMQQLGQSWREHKQQYLSQVQQADAAVQRVVLADKLHNGRSLLTNLRLGGDAVWQQFSGSRQDILWLQWQQVELFQQVSQSWMVEELMWVVERICSVTGAKG